MEPASDAFFSDAFLALGTSLLCGIVLVLILGCLVNRPVRAVLLAFGLVVVAGAVASFWAMSPRVQDADPGRGRVTCNFDALSSAFPQSVRDETERRCMQKARLYTWGGGVVWILALGGGLALANRSSAVQPRPRQTWAAEGQ